MHDIALGTEIKHGVECDRVKGDAPFGHFLIRAENILGTPGHDDYFENGGVNDGVDGGPRLF